MPVPVWPVHALRCANVQSIFRSQVSATVITRQLIHTTPRAPERFLGTRLFGNWLAAGIIRNLFGVTVSDLGPLRAARADALRVAEPEETTYGWAVELIGKGAIHGLRIVEVAGKLSFYGLANRKLAARSKELSEGPGSFSALLPHITSSAVRSARGNRREHPYGNVPSDYRSGLQWPPHIADQAKAPRPGMVKTRLARSLPVSAVTGFHRCLLDDTISLRSTG
jgi:hypothetical protein